MANEPQQHIEDVNSFGTDLPKRIKAKLTARQLLAQHALEPNQSIQFPFPEPQIYPAGHQWLGCGPRSG